MTATALTKSLQPRRAMGLVCTFYSYKGGLGRSMALANVGALLGRRHRVLIVDFHLESPGLERFFENKPARLHGSRHDICGVVDLIESRKRGLYQDWRDCLLWASPFGAADRIAIMTAGRESEDYVKQVQDLEWPALFKEHDLGWYLEELRSEWTKDFDFILIDSPSGITDISGICTIHLADVLVLFCTTNVQSIDGIVDVMKRAKRAQTELLVDRGQLVGIPVRARDESRIAHRQSVKWRKTLEHKLSFIYEDWLPEGVTTKDVLQELRVPYIPYWSFSEQLAVVQEGTDNAKSLGFAYKLLARLIEHRLDWNEAIAGQHARRKDKHLASQPMAF